MAETEMTRWQNARLVLVVAEEQYRANDGTWVTLKPGFGRAAGAEGRLMLRAWLKISDSSMTLKVPESIPSDGPDLDGVALTLLDEVGARGWMAVQQEHQNLDHAGVGSYYSAWLRRPIQTA